MRIVLNWFIMDIETIKKLKNKSKGLDAVVQIGKNGITFAIIEQIKRIVKKKKLIKIKLSRGFVEEQEQNGKKKKDIGILLATDTNTQLIDVVGFTVSLSVKIRN